MLHIGCSKRLRGSRNENRFDGEKSVRSTNKDINSCVLATQCAVTSERSVGIKTLCTISPDQTHLLCVQWKCCLVRFQVRNLPMKCQVSQLGLSCCDLQVLQLHSHAHVPRDLQFPLEEGLRRNRLGGKLRTKSCLYIKFQILLQRCWQTTESSHLCHVSSDWQGTKGLRHQSQFNFYFNVK